MKVLRLVLVSAIVIILNVKSSSAALHLVSILGGVSGSFSPPNIEIDDEDQIRWTNNGSSTHNSRSGTPGNPSGVWSSPNLSVGGMYTRTFSTPGTFPYYCSLHDFTGQVKVNAVSGILDDPDADDNLPNLIALRQNSPNPFNAATQIEYSLDRDEDIQLTIYNILGQEVATLVDGFQTGGFHTVTWDGRDNHDREAPSGIYFARMITPAALMTRKMVLLR